VGLAVVAEANVSMREEQFVKTLQTVGSLGNHCFLLVVALGTSVLDFDHPFLINL
jgi:hypothetical protein